MGTAAVKHLTGVAWAGTNWRVKLFVAVLMLALSGVANAAVVAASLTRDSTEAHEAGCADCEQGCDGPCSPLCNDCVCSFGARSMPSVPAALLSAPPVIGTIDGPIVASTAPPRAPELGDVFHPPRH